MKFLLIALAAAALTGAQTPGISIRPNTATIPTVAAGSPVVGSRLGAPVLGYVTGPGSLDVRFLFGTPKTAQLGDAVPLPGNVKHLLLPPRQHYFLLESKAVSDPLRVWQPLNPAGGGVTLVGVLPHPDQVAFSARGDAAALYAKSADRLQVVAGLPAEPVLKSQLKVSQWGDPVSLAVSDDGEIVVALLADGAALVSWHAGEWKRFPSADGARAILFISRTHNLVVSDTAQQTLTLVSNVAEPGQSARLLSHHVSADHLAATKDGLVLLAATSSANKVWTVDMKTSTATPVSSSSIETLLPLRDGHTFLLSSSGVELLNVPSDYESASGLAPVTR